MSTEEKKRLVEALTLLAPDDLDKALLIVAENNPTFQATAEHVDLDMDTQVFVLYVYVYLHNICTCTHMHMHTCIYKLVALLLFH